MTADGLKKKLLPMSETMYYILYSLQEERHGYGIMQYVKDLTGGRVVLGAGTIYQSLSKLEHDGLAAPAQETGRRKEYRITDTGREILRLESRRICELYEIAKEVLA